MSARRERGQPNATENAPAPPANGMNLSELCIRRPVMVVLLSLTEFWIVYALTKHPGHVKNRQQLMDAANVVLDDNTITSHIKRIRRKFQVVDEKFDAVHTVYGMGYRWVE